MIVRKTPNTFSRQLISPHSPSILFLEGKSSRGKRNNIGCLRTLTTSLIWCSWFSSSPPPAEWPVRSSPESLLQPLDSLAFLLKSRQGHKWSILWLYCPKKPWWCELSGFQFGQCVHSNHHWISSLVEELSRQIRSAQLAKRTQRAADYTGSGCHLLTFTSISVPTIALDFHSVPFSHPVHVYGHRQAPLVVSPTLTCFQDVSEKMCIYSVFCLFLQTADWAP